MTGKTRHTTSKLKSYRPKIAFYNDSTPPNINHYLKSRWPCWFIFSCHEFHPLYSKRSASVIGLVTMEIVCTDLLLWSMPMNDHTQM